MAPDGVRRAGDPGPRPVRPVLGGSDVSAGCVAVELGSFVLLWQSAFVVAVGEAALAEIEELLRLGEEAGRLSGKLAEVARAWEVGR